MLRKTIGFTLPLLFMVIVLGISPTEQAFKIITIPSQELGRIQFIIFQGEALDISTWGDIHVKLGPVWETADIVMLGKEGERHPSGQIEGEFLIRVENALLKHGGIVLSYGAYSHEVYIGQVLNEELEFLVPTGSSFETETINTSDIAAVELQGGITLRVIHIDGTVDDSPKTLLSPLQINLAIPGGVTGHAPEEFRLELADPEMCPDDIKGVSREGGDCLISAKSLRIVDLKENSLARLLFKYRFTEAGEEAEPTPGEGFGQPKTGEGIKPPLLPSYCRSGAPSSPKQNDCLAPAVGEEVNFWYPDPSVPDCRKYPYDRSRCPPATEIDEKRIESWEWTFGDGSTSAEPEPVHVYDRSGTYEVCVILFLEDTTKLKSCASVDVWLEGHLSAEKVGIELSIWSQKREGEGTCWEHPSLAFDPSEVDYILIHQRPTPALGSPLAVCPTYCPSPRTYSICSKGGD